MIYTVECSFADPDTEATWNDFYSHTKLPALIAVPRFHTSQRFRLLKGDAPTYLALHTIDHPDVLTSAVYHNHGGGHFGRLQTAITDWRRNVYDSETPAPAVGDDAVLVATNRGPEAMRELGLAPMAMIATALDRTPERRWLAVIVRNRVPDASTLSPGLQLYAPMTPQLTSDQAA